MFDTLVDPEAAKVKNEMLLRAFKPVCNILSQNSNSKVALVHTGPICMQANLLGANVT